MAGRGPNAEIQENIQDLAKRNQKLERLVAKIGTKQDDDAFRIRLEKDLKETNQLASSIITAINAIKERSEKAMVQRLTNEFSREFQKYQKMNDQVKLKDNRIMAAAGADVESGRASSGDKHRKVRIPSDSGEDGARPGAGRRGGDEGAGAALLSDQIEFLEYDVEELETRHERIQNIEKEVTEVSEMFHDLLKMVNQQGETIDQIDQNISSARDQTQQAHQELIEAEKLQAKERNKKCCIIFILLIIAGAIVLGVTLR